MTNDQPESESSQKLRVGNRVRHPKWGLGRISRVSGSGESTNVIVDFNEEGFKKLALKHAQLTRVGAPAGPRKAAQPTHKPKTKLRKAAPRVAREGEDDDDEEEVIIPG